MKITSTFVFLLILYFAGSVALNFIDNTCYAAQPHSVSVAGGNIQNGSLSPMLKKILPSIVNIAVSGELSALELQYQERQLHGRRGDGIIPKFTEFGSGVIVDAEGGYILTNAHVVRDSQIIIVSLNDGRKFNAKIIGYDAASDIAVLQINAKKISQIVIGDSDDLNVGDFVCAIGDPMGLQHTVTSGVVSAMERDNLGIEGYENFIQTDAPINPGNSGGALVNMKGELIGINTAIVTPNPISGSVGLGLAIPSNMAKSVMDQIIKYGKVERGILGILVQNVNDSLAELMHLPSKDGALVATILPNSPADRAGLKSKDFIVQIMDKKVRSANQVRNMVSLQRSGTSIPVKVWRGDKFVMLNMLISDPKGIKGDEIQEGSLLYGLVLKNFDQLVDGERVMGVQISQVEESGTAYSCGLKQNDVVTKVDGTAIKDVEAFSSMIAKGKNNKVLLEVRRGRNGIAFIALEK